MNGGCVNYAWKPSENAAALDMDHPLLLLIVMPFCLALSFLFSGMEAGLFALNRLRLRQKARRGDRNAKILLGHLENLEDFLWTILIGNTLANLFVVGLVTAGLHDRLGDRPLSFLAAFLVFVFLLYALADFLPKMLFQAPQLRLCLALARPFQFIHVGLSPIVALLAWFARGLLRFTGGSSATGRLFGNREELRLVMQESSQGFTSEERSMINRVLDFQNLTVRQITIPLEKTTLVQVATPMAEVLDRCRETHFTRLPVQQSTDGRSRIVGIVSLKTLLYQADFNPACAAGHYVKPALYLSEDLRLEAALQRMQKSGQRLAIVLDRNQGELGIISLQDILKAIFGEVNL